MVVGGGGEGFLMEADLLRVIMEVVVVQGISYEYLHLSDSYPSYNPFSKDKN